MGWLSDLFKNEQTSQLEGWDPAMGGLNAAMDIGEQALQNPWDVYGGQLVAGLNPNQNAALQGMAGYGAGMGGDIAGAAAGAGMAGLAGGLGGYGGVLSGLQGGAPQVGQLDQGYANQIANNPYVDSMITSSLRDPYRQLTEQTIPGITAGAVAAGQPGGSEQSQMSDIARRGYEDRAADVGASIRGNAYSQGLGIANQQATMNPGLQMQGYGLQNQAAGGLSGIGQWGLPAGYGMGQSNLSMQLGAGNIQQGQQQTELDAAQNQYYLGQQLPMQQAQQGINMFSPLAQGFGETTQTQTTGLGNAGVQIGGQILAAYATGGTSLLGGLGGGSNAPAGGSFLPSASQYFGGSATGAVLDPASWMVPPTYPPLPPGG